MTQGLFCMRSPDCRKLSYISAIREALDQAMELDDSVIIIGEGVPDPKAIFKSTSGLYEKYGCSRVFDMPLAENGLTGVCIGAALSGMRPIMVHQRIDFALLSMDQIVNNAAKWRYMFNGKSCVPLVIRMIVGRGWGQGPQHSQSLQSLFAAIPGLKVVMPTTAYDAKGMLIAAIRDNNPVIFIEHRWLHHIEDEVPEHIYEVPLGKANIVHQGGDVTIAAFSYMTFEALKAARCLFSFMGIGVELIDMRSVRPLDVNLVKKSLEKTGRLIVVDTAHKTGSIAGELITNIAEEAFHLLRAAPVRICTPDFPTPTASSMTLDYYPTSLVVAKAVIEVLGKANNSDSVRKVMRSLELKDWHDVPSHEFNGPF
jgi:pyruvate/2-oxoglutarate/acetoin dehydrogenase E1 component